MLLTNLVPSIFHVVHLGTDKNVGFNSSWFDSHSYEATDNESKDLAFCYMYTHIAINKNDIQYKYYN